MQAVSTDRLPGEADTHRDGSSDRAERARRPPPEWRAGRYRYRSRGRFAEYRLQLWSAPGRSVSVVRCSGEVDVSSAAALWETIEQAFPLAEARLVVDFSQAQFLDAAALGLLIRACRRCQSLGGAFAVACPSARLRNVFSITRLERGISVLPSLRAALDLVAPATSEAR